jgi:hypothetical protein
VFCHSQEQARQVKARLAEWLAPRGLAFNEDKTTVVHLSQGFDFLGVNVRRYPNGTLLTKLGQVGVRDDYPLLDRAARPSVDARDPHHRSYGFIMESA